MTLFWGDVNRCGCRKCSESKIDVGWCCYPIIHYRKVFMPNIQWSLDYGMKDSTQQLLTSNTLWLRVWDWTPSPQIFHFSGFSTLSEPRKNQKHVFHASATNWWLFQPENFFWALRAPRTRGLVRVIKGGFGPRGAPKNRCFYLFWTQTRLQVKIAPCLSQTHNLVACRQ